MLKNKNISKIVQIPLIVGIAVFAFLGLAYIYRLRTALGNTTESYKATIVDLEERVLRLQEKNAALKNEIINQGTYITNGASENYILEISPSNLSLNNVVVQEEETDKIRFIAAGHLYGAHSNDGGTIPANTLIDSIAEINELSPNLFFALGDLAQYPSKQNFQELQHNFLDKIDAPIFNAPGNHDFDNGRVFYENEFGQTFYFFKYAQSQIIVLDTEIANCFIVGKQKKMLEQAVDLALADEEINHIFVFIHKVLFLNKSITSGAEPNAYCRYGNNYIDLQDEILLPAAQRKPVYLIAGDVGAFDGNLSPFYNKYPDANLYTLAIGLGDSPNDVLLQIDIHAAEVDFKLIPIGGNQPSPLESYTPEYWATQ